MDYILVRACACAIGIFQTRWYHYNHSLLRFLFSLSFLHPPQLFFFWKKWKKRKVLRIAWFGDKIDQKNILKFPPPLDFEKNKKCLELPDLAKSWSEFLLENFTFPPPRLLCRHVHRKVTKWQVTSDKWQVTSEN